jgi:hypothetical protein
MTRFGLLLGVGLAAGCHPSVLAPPARPAAPQLPVTSRKPIEPDISAVPHDPAKSPPTRPAEYRRLTAAECRVLAVQNAPLAAELDAHPDNKPPAHPCLQRNKPELAEQSRLARGYAADEIRNRSASDALGYFYKLAAAEGQFDLLLAAHGILKVQLAAAEKVIKAGAEDRADVDRLRRQIFDIESQMAKLEAGIDVLNSALAGQLGLPPGDPTPLWPEDPLRVGGQAPDAEQMVQVAMQNRPDLNLLRVLAASSAFDTALTKAVLTGVNPLLAPADPTNPLSALLAQFKHNPTRAEAKLHAQLLGLLATRERQADAEVRAAVATLRGDRLSVAAKAAEVRNLQTEVGEHEKRVAAGVAGAQAQLATARVNLLKARGELLQAAVDWHVSSVKLRQATGLLVRE